jgi:hypothetical protein
MISLSALQVSATAAGLLILLLSSLLITPVVFAQQIPLPNTFDSEKYGIRIHYPNGWVVIESSTLEEARSARMTAGPVSTVSPYDIALAMCPLSQIENNLLYDEIYRRYKLEHTAAINSTMTVLCVATHDGIAVNYKQNLNRSESPFLSGKQNVTLDDYVAYQWGENERSGVLQNARVLNVTDALIKVINSTTNQTVRELPAKIIETFTLNNLSGEYQTLLELLTVNENTGYVVQDLNLEDNRILVDLQGEHQLLQQSVELLD